MGEYAVLLGHPAVVAAVDVRAVCTRQGGLLSIDKDDGGLVDAVLAEAGLAEAGDVDGSIVVDTGAFRSGNEKYGLGSSAAACVALLRALLPQIAVDELHVRAQRAHRQFQKGKGSGVDVCASVYGGVCSFVRKPDDVLEVDAVAPLPAAIALLPVWTGVSADTRVFLARFSALAVERQRHLVRPLAAAAYQFEEACDADDALALLQAVERAALQFEALSEALGDALLVPAHYVAATICSDFGGVAKPSGAGGGDVSLCFVPREAEASVRATLAANKLQVLPFAVGGDVSGVDVVGDGA